MSWKAILLLAAIALPAGGAGDAALDRSTLRGLTSVSVAIDPVGAELAKEGVTADLLRARLEQKLKAAGINVNSTSTEFVGLHLISVQSQPGKFVHGTFAVAATIGLYQPVTLVRDKNLKTATQTWEVDTVVLADPKQVDRACLDSVDELASRFAAAYKSVNASASRDGDGQRL